MRQTGFEEPTLSALCWRRGLIYLRRLRFETDLSSYLINTACIPAGRTLRDGRTFSFSGSARIGGLPLFCQVAALRSASRTCSSVIVSARFFLALLIWPAIST